MTPANQEILNNLMQATENNNLDSFKEIFDNSISGKEDVINDIGDNFSIVLSKAAEKGHLNIFNELVDRLPNMVSDMLAVDNYSIFRITCQTGNLSMVNRLIELLGPEQIHAMTSSWDYEVYRAATASGNLELLERLIALNPDIFLELLAADVFLAFRQEAERRHRNMLIRLGTLNPSQIAKMIQLQGINATPNSAQRSTRINQTEDIRDYLDFSRARFNLASLASMQDTLARPNSALNLSATAENPESSMQRLTPGEEKRLLAAKLHYQEQLQAQGSARIIENFKQDLKRRYEENPAKVRAGDGREIELPFEWTDAARLMTTLSADTREAALKAFYQHPTHTAYRYFLKPNPWLDKNANFVTRDALGNGWSSFENYQDLIALLIVAANDENIPEVEGFNKESRVSELIQEIALINRAHNWDESRLNSETRRHEEYDNQKPDRPSCRPGVKRRLFQAVKKHPLLELLTTEMIDEEIRPFIKAHFKEEINAKNCSELQQAWQQVIEGEPPPEVLKRLDISEVQQQRLIESISTTLRNKYGPQFDDDPSLKAHLTKSIQITPPFSSHAEKFGGIIDLEAILEEKVKSSPLSKEEIRSARLKYLNSTNEKKGTPTPPTTKP